MSRQGAERIFKTRVGRIKKQSGIVFMEFNNDLRFRCEITKDGFMGAKWLVLTLNLIILKIQGIRILGINTCFLFKNKLETTLDKNVNKYR